MIVLSEEQICIEEVIHSVNDPGAGGHVHFVGTIREEEEIKGIRYESYLPMAFKKIEEIVSEAKLQWPVKKISIFHRLGFVPVGEAAVVIAVSSTHRKEAFLACEFMIDRIKEVVPIWKDGGTLCCHH